MLVVRLIIILLIIVALGLIAYHDTHSFVVRNYEFSSPKLSRDVTFVLLSDLHGYVFGKDNDKLISAIDEINPDYILCAGDMFTAREVKGRIHTEAGFKLLKTLSKKYPIYISNGNHEEKIKVMTKFFGNLFDRYKNSLIREGITYLENDSIDIPEANIRISGLSLPLEYFRKVIKKKMEDDTITGRVGEVKNKDRYQVLIAHNPQYFKDYSAWGADLTVSGHVHGGIIRLPLLGGVISPSLALFPRYDGGKYEKDGRVMILSRGLGTHTIHVRINNPGEVSVIRVKGEKNVTRS